MATKKPMKKPVKRVRRFQEGGEAALKAEGLAASNKDAPMGFFESLRRLGQGNIDQEGSEAYNRYGAGRGRMERDAKDQDYANRLVDAMNAGNGANTRALAPVSAGNADAGVAQSQTFAKMAEDDDAARGLAMRTAAESEKDYKKYTGPIAKPVAAAQNAALLAAKSNKASVPRIGKSATGSGGGRGAAVGEEDAYRASRAAAPAAAPAAPRNGASAIPGASAAQAATAASPDGERVTGNEISRRFENTLLATGAGGVGLLGLAAKLKKAYQASKAPGTGFILKGGRFVKDPNAPTKRPRKALPSPVTDVTAKTAKQMAETNLRERGNKFLFADDAMKRGGRVKKMAHGGFIKSTVSTASKRGDGIALRGKTRGKMY